MNESFGVGGFPVAWSQSEYRYARYGKYREGIFPWLAELGLNWLELECTHGVRMSMDQAKSYAECAERFGVNLSIHAPYYCVMSSQNIETRVRSKRDIISCFDLAAMLGAKRIIFHPGYPGYDRSRSIDMIVEAMLELDAFRPEGVHLYPEIGGKLKQLGSLDEILQICEAVPSAIPCIDLAHLHARDNGIITTVDDVLSVIDEIGNRLGIDRLEQTHYHVYPIKFGAKGEISHLPHGTDISTTPLEELFVEAMLLRGLSPVVISEASNSQEKGAMYLRDLFANG